VLIAEGDAQDRSVFVIRSGSVTVSRRTGGREVTLAYLPAGHLVGEMALLRSGVRNATVRAAIATEVIRIDGAAFAELVASRPDLGRKLDALMRERMLSGVAREEALGDDSVIAPLLGRGLGEATDVLLIDESLCIRCDNCEKACAESHDGISRLDREAGPTFGDIHLPTSCRHCEHPHCMADCPPDAIHRAPGGEVWIDPGRCIGCGNCEANCPYGVIQMAAPPPKKPGLLRWLLFGSGPGPGEDQAARHAHPPAGAPAKAKLAVKCDMCKDIEGGAACVRACPTGAALRVSPEAFFNTVGLQR
jgi:Fe-S-cluster-containing hydrogenase component 2